MALAASGTFFLPRLHRTRMPGRDADPLRHYLPPAMAHERGFTLLEVALAVLIAMLILLVATPSIESLLAHQRFKKSFDAFEILVAEAQTRSARERRPFQIAWVKDFIVVRPAEEEEAQTEWLQIANEEKAAFTLELPASLARKPQPAWTFWPSGACEPAIVSFHGRSGNWTARYDPLTARAQVTLHERP